MTRPRMYTELLHQDEEDFKSNRTFESELLRFCLRAEGLSVSFSDTIAFITEAMRCKIAKWEELQATIGSSVCATQNEAQVPAHLVHQLQQLDLDVTHANTVIKVVPETIFCALVHSYDSFIGNLLRVAYETQPQIVNASAKTLTFAELNAFSTIEEARNYIIENEVENLLRKSHSEQIKTFSTLFSVKLEPTSSCWRRFIEITERRNLLVHCDGRVSRQYLAVCEKNKVELEPAIKLNSVLTIDRKYFETALDCVYEMGVLLGQVIWRKLLSKSAHEANAFLLAQTYALLLSNRNYSVMALADFLLNIPKHTNDSERLHMVINKCVALNNLDKKDEALELLKKTDWSATSPKFQLAKAVLEEQFQRAAELMVHIGSAGEVTKHNYATWPLFRNFRKESYFLTSFLQVFGEEFSSDIEERMTLLEALVSTLNGEASQRIDSRGGTYDSRTKELDAFQNEAGESKR